MAGTHRHRSPRAAGSRHTARGRALVVDRRRLAALAIDELATGALTLLGLWGETARSTWRCSTEPSARSRSSRSMSGRPFPSSARCTRRRSGWSGRIRDLYGLEPVGLPDTRPGSIMADGMSRHPLGGAAEATPASARPTLSCRPRAKACTRSRWARCMPASSSPGTSASPPTARRSCGSRSGSAMCTRASSR